MATRDISRPFVPTYLHSHLQLTVHSQKPSSHPPWPKLLENSVSWFVEVPADPHLSPSEHLNHRRRRRRTRTLPPRIENRRRRRPSPETSRSLCASLLPRALPALSKMLADYVWRKIAKARSRNVDIETFIF